MNGWMDQWIYPGGWMKEKTTHDGCQINDSSFRFILNIHINVYKRSMTVHLEQFYYERSINLSNERSMTVHDNSSTKTISERS